MNHCWLLFSYLLILIRVTFVASKSCKNCQCAEDPCPPWWVDRDDRILFDYAHGQVSVSSSAAASVKYPLPGTGEAPQAYISSLSSAKADPRIPVTINDGAAAVFPKQSWAYFETATAYGPANWPKIAPQCNGKHQSPINIITRNVALKPFDSPLRLSKIVEDGLPVLNVQGKLVNNGKTIGFNINDGAPSIRISGAVLGPNTYKFRQFHIHFGCAGQMGSEHTLDGQQFPGEFHLVFVNEKYADPKVAMQQRDGLVILAFFMVPDPETPPNPMMLKIVQHIANIRNPHSQVPLPGGINLRELVPNLKEGITNLRRFVYRGSIPTPPCFESVTWVIFQRPFRILPDRLLILRNVQGDGGRLLCGNHRPIEPRNGREVFSFSAPRPTTAASFITKAWSTTHAPTTQSPSTAPTTVASVAASTTIVTMQGSSTVPPSSGPSSDAAQRKKQTF